MASAHSERFCHFNNVQAEAWESYWGPSGASLGLSFLAYTTRGGIPRIPLRPNLHVSLVPLVSGRGVNLTQTEYHEAWNQKRLSNRWGPFRLGVVKEWLQTGTNLDVPRMAALEAIRDGKSALDNGVTAWNLQNTYSGACQGIHLWLLSQYIWDPTMDVAARIDEWFSLAFGQVAVPVRRFFERAWH